ncbi:MAG: ATP-binding protein, partial [Polaribacter sp.]
MENKKVNGEVIAVLPNKVKIKIDDLNAFKGAEQLKVGSYIQIADNENSDIKLIAIIESFLIEVNESGDRKYMVEANPLGTIEDGIFRRGGDSIALPPKEATTASTEDIKAIYSSGSKESNYERFCFAQLSHSSKDRIDVPVNGNKFFNKHFAIVGSTGSGKSHTTAKVLQNATQEKKSDFKGLNNSHIIIFDIHSEYASAFPESNSITINDLILPYWLLNGDELEELFLESGDNNNYNQSSLLRTLITENKISKNPLESKVYFDSPLKFDIDEVLICLQNLKKETKHTENDLDIQFLDAPKTFKSDSEKYQHYFKKTYEFTPTRRAKAPNHGISKGAFSDGSIDKFVSRLNTKVDSQRLRQFLFGDKSKNISFEDTLRQFLGYDYKPESRKNAKSNVTIIDLSGVPFEVLSITVSLISRLLFDYAYYYKKKVGDNDMPLLLVYEEAHK